MNVRILNIYLTIIGFALFIGTASINAQISKDEKFKLRCGWLDNPTTATYSLSDKDRQWIIGEQGGYQVEGFTIPKFKKGQWESFFGGSYGFGCACFQMKVDYETSYVLEIRKSYARPLAACKKDKALRKWKDEF